MTPTQDRQPKLPAGKKYLAAALAATFLLGSFSGTAAAYDRYHHGYHREIRGHRVYTGGYYPAPPVVYGGPYYGGYPGYYAPPPVVYGTPGIGLNINLR